MECKIIGAEIVSTKGKTGVIIDKALRECHNASITTYICMEKDGNIFNIDYNEISSISKFVVNPNSDFPTYLRTYKNK